MNILNEYLKQYLQTSVKMIIEADSNGPQFNTPDPSMDAVASGDPSAAPADPSVPGLDMSGAPDMSAEEPPPEGEEDKPAERITEPKDVEDFMTNAGVYAKTSQNDPATIVKGLKADIQDSPQFNTVDKVEELLTSLLDSEDSDIKIAGERLKRYLNIEAELQNAN